MTNLITKVGGRSHSHVDNRISNRYFSQVGGWSGVELWKREKEVREHEKKTRTLKSEIRNLNLPNSQDVLAILFFHSAHAIDIDDIDSLIDKDEPAWVAGIFFNFFESVNVTRCGRGEWLLRSSRASPRSSARMSQLRLGLEGSLCSCVPDLSKI